jgi:hypothetical protein
MTLPGIVTNVTAFGAFVDIGVHQDGLVHVSQLADRFVRDPNEVVKVHQQVEVTVLEVDPARKRIALSMRKGPRTPISPPASSGAGGRGGPLSPGWHEVDALGTKERLGHLGLPSIGGAEPDDVAVPPFLSLQDDCRRDLDGIE